MQARWLMLILPLAWAPAARASQCLPTTPQDQFAAAEWVFVGEIVDRTAETARLRVARTLKGPPAREASIALDAQGPLAVPAAEGRAVLVFAHRQGAAWAAGMCSGTGVVQRQDERLLALGFGERDFEDLRLPTDAALMRQLASEWQAYRAALLACPDARCYRRLQGNRDDDPASLAYYEREFPLERALCAALAAPESHRLVGGGIGASTAYLRFALARPYRPPHEAAYDGFEVEFRRIDDGHWAIEGARARVLANLPPVRERHRAWTGPAR